jgi:lipid II:glycine glycyltransferase (peptidoglycan interpeptide bridge formation enzyme)
MKDRLRREIVGGRSEEYLKNSESKFDSKHFNSKLLNLKETLSNIRTNLDQYQTKFSKSSLSKSQNNFKEIEKPSELLCKTERSSICNEKPYFDQHRITFSHCLNSKDNQ